MITQTFESSSSSAIYTARLNPETGEASCDCPGWKFKRGDGARSCKHTRVLEAMAPGATSARATFIEPTTPAIALTPGQKAAATRRAREMAARSPFVAAVIEDERESAIRNAAADHAAARLVPKPMLASAMTRGTLADYCTSEWVLEEKYDGHRVIVRKQGQVVDAWSRPRSGKDALRRELPAHLIDAMRHLPDGIYDGELVTRGGRSWDVARVDSVKQLAIFDAIELLGQSVIAPTSRNRVYHERRAALLLAVAHHTRQADAPVLFVPDAVPVSQEAVAAIWARGGEGAILKRVDSTYQPGRRSPDWVKVKKAGSATLTITGYEAGKMGPYSVLKLRADDGRETTVKVLTNQMRADIAAAPESFIGRRVVIAFCELTDTGSFRHGIFDHLAGEGE